MGDDGRVVTAKLPEELISELDQVSERIERSKSWILRQALSDWLSEEQRRHEVTLAAMESVQNGRGIEHEEALALIERRKRELRAERTKSAP